MDGLDPNNPGVPSDPSARAGRFTTDDPCIHEQATAPWDTTVTPLSRGPYRHVVAFLATQRVILYREQISIPTRIQGLSPPGMFAVTVPLRIAGHTSYWGTPLHEQGLPATMPGGAHVDFSAGQQHLMVLIDLGFIRDSLPEDLREAIERAAQGHVIPASRDVVARLGARLNTLLEGALADPPALRHSHAVRAMEEDLLAAFRQSITVPTRVPRRVGRAARQRGLQRAVEYLQATDARLVTVPELCSSAQVTQRTLEYAFHESFGLSPRAFLTLRRYHAVRRGLLAADGSTAKVRDIAEGNGFYQMGRFAVRYKELFGESPSQTLKKPPSVAQHHLRPWKGVVLPRA